MRRETRLHVLFGVTLLTLVALAAWWTVFFGRAVELERRSALAELGHEAQVAAITLGCGDRRPAPGPLAERELLAVGARSGPAAMEVSFRPDPAAPDLFFPAAPNFPELGVRPTVEAVRAVDLRHRRRRVMVAGEGGLLFVLLGLCTFMFYHLVRQERRYLARVERFISAASHEMKTPLAGIKSLLQTFASGRVPEEEARRLYSLGLQEAERLEHTVENVLLAGRLRAARYEPRLEQAELRAVLEQFREHRRLYTPDRPEAVRVAWEVAEPELYVLADLSGLRVILDNLTDNAFKYGGEVPQVVLRVRAAEGRALLAVEDRGVGFATGDAEALFAPFQRTGELGAVAHHGTGLGLSLARSLARRMGGELTASSEGPGKGSRFTLTLQEARP